jgi:hypothetical protein
MTLLSLTVRVNFDFGDPGDDENCDKGICWGTHQHIWSVSHEPLALKVSYEIMQEILEIRTEI